MLAGKRISTSQGVRRSGVWVVALVAGSMLVSAPSRAEISDEPIALVDLGEFADTSLKSDLRLSDSGRYLTLDASDGTLRDYVHIDLDTGVVTDVELDRVTPSEDGDSVIGEILGGDGTLYREDLTTHELQRLTTAGTDGLVSAEFPGWSLMSRAVSADGRYVLYSARSPDNFVVEGHVWDLDADELATPKSGLPREESRVAVLGLNVRDGRNTVEYQSYAGTGARFSTYEIYDLVSGAHTVIRPPDSWSPLRGSWHISPDLNWVVFPSDEANVVPGLSALPRYYHYNRTTEETTELPVDHADVGPIRVFDSGALGFTALDDLGQENLFWWSGEGDPDPLVRGFDGGSVDIVFTISDGRWDFSASGESVVLSSPATNIVEGIDPGSFINRVYRIGSSTEPVVVPISNGAEANVQAQRCRVSGCA